MGAGSDNATVLQAQWPNGLRSLRVRCGRGFVGACCLLLLLASGSFSGCAVREQIRRVCMDVEASEDLNFYDEKAHRLTLLVYALSDPAGFERVSIAELLSGSRPPGVLEPPVPLTVEPAAKLNWEGVFPAATRSVGVVADFDREAVAEEGVAPGSDRRVVLPARCGFMRPRLKLGESRIESS